MSKIMIVEDNHINRKMFTGIVKSMGFEAVLKESGENIIEDILSTSPELILMDVQLPDISGIELTKMIKQHPQTKDIPVIIISAFVLEEDIKKINASGCNSRLTKPIEIDEFIKTITELMGKK